MTSLGQEAQVIDQLAKALNQNRIPSQYLKMAQQLLTRLRKPVRVVITGPKGAGKSTLLNMMLAQKVVTETDSAPVIELAFGDAERVIFEGRDGSTTEKDGLVCDLSIPDTAVRVRQELPAPDLMGQNLFEVALGSGEHAASVVEWVAGWADIILWCTEEFAEYEQALWHTGPDELKDRSCLVLTKADQQLSQGTLDTTTSNLASVVEEEFLGLFPIASRQALKARTDAACLSSSRWASSGGQRLLETVTQLIAQGRSETLDHAQMLIDTCAEDAPNAEPEQEAQPVERPIVSPKMPAQNSNAQDDDEVAVSDGYESALAILENGAEQLLDLASGASLDNEQVISVCTDTLAQLSDHMATPPQGEPLLKDAFADVQDGKDMVLLCELEGCEDAATDAVTVLLQLKKEFREKSTQLH